MKLIRLKANSIHTAIADARREYGDDVILMESHPANGIKKAEIVIAIGGSAAAPSKVGDRDQVRPERPAHRTGSVLRHADVQEPALTVGALRNSGFESQLTDQLLSGAAVAAQEISRETRVQEDLRRQLPGSVKSSHEARLERIMGTQGAVAVGPTSRDNSKDGATDAWLRESHAREEISTDPPTPQSKRPRQLAKFVDAANSIVNRVRQKASGEQTSTQHLATKIESNELITALESPKRVNDESLPTLETIDNRLQLIERQLAGSSISFANKWISHPLYSEMTASGYSANTVVSVLSTLASRGVPANAANDYLRNRIYEELRRRNKTVVANTRTGCHLFIGASGCGKSNLILKAAQDPETLAAGRAIVLMVNNYNSGSLRTTEYTEAGIECLNVHSAQQLEYSRGVLSRYDTILVDSSPLDGDTGSQEQQVAAILEILSSINGITIHYVVDARRNLDDVSEEIARCNYDIDALALTNIDGLAKLGRLVDFLLTKDHPVFFVSAGRHVPGQGLDRYCPAEMFALSLGLEEWPYSDNELSDYFRTASTRSAPSKMNFTESAGYRPLGLNG